MASKLEVTSDATNQGGLMRCFYLLLINQSRTIYKMSIRRISKYQIAPTPVDSPAKNRFPAKSFNPHLTFHRIIVELLQISTYRAEIGIIICNLPGYRRIDLRETRFA